MDVVGSGKQTHPFYYIPFIPKLWNPPFVYNKMCGYWSYTIGYCGKDPKFPQKKIKLIFRWQNKLVVIDELEIR